MTKIYKKSTFLITTHSMEEAETLCTKIAIMVQGKFKTIGSLEKLKEKYGSNLELEIKLRIVQKRVVKQKIKDLKKKLNLDMFELSDEKKTNILQEIYDPKLKNKIFSDPVLIREYQDIESLKDFIFWLEMKKKTTDLNSFMDK